MKNRYLYVCNTMDEYELPIAVAANVPELARMVGTTVNCIYSTISHCQKKGLKSRFGNCPECPAETVYRDHFTSYHYVNSCIPLRSSSLANAR